MCVFVPRGGTLQRSGINSSDVEVLLLTNVTEEDSGEYTCQVSNYIGHASQSSWLTVLPGKTRNETSLPPSAGVLGCFFCRHGDPGIFAEPLWCGLVFYFPYFFWWIFPGAIQPWKQAFGLSSPLPSCPVLCQASRVCFSLSFIAFLWRKAAACFPCFFTCVCMDP